jgi:dipeptide/tripeptide permease
VTNPILAARGNGIVEGVLTAIPDEKVIMMLRHLEEMTQSHNPNNSVRPPYESTQEDAGSVLPTEEDKSTLRRVSGSIPWVAYSLCIVEFGERASYYGCSFVFSNFIQFPLPRGGNGAGAPPAGTQETAGALNKGLAISSALTLLFQFLAYTVPISGGWIADTKLGRFKTICIGVAVCGVAHVFLVVGALPSVLQAGNGMALFIIGLLTLAMGAGRYYLLSPTHSTIFNC